MTLEEKNRVMTLLLDHSARMAYGVVPPAKPSASLLWLLRELERDR